MSLNLASVQSEYVKDKDLKENDVKALLEWTSKQPHLPQINELQAILFLQSCYYRNEAAKVAMDNYFTIKTFCSDMYGPRDPFSLPVINAMNFGIYTTLPKKSPEGYTIVLVKMIELDPSKFVFVDQIRSFDMFLLLHLYLEGTSNGHVVVYDMEGLTFGHLTRMGPFTLKKLVHYVEGSMPIRLKGIHLINPVFHVGKFVGMLKPLISKELANLLFVHNKLDDFFKAIPQNCLPMDYGGSADEISVLHEKMKSRLQENVELFQWEDSQKVDESLRPGKPKNVSDLFGVEGTFKLLEID